MRARSAAGGRRRGGNETLTREAVIQAAGRIISAEGIDAMTMRRLGAELGVTPPAIYWHVPTRDDILRGVVERALLDVVLPEDGDGPWDRAAQLCGALRAVYAGRPFLFELSIRFPVRGGVRALDAMIGLMRAAGFDRRGAVDAAKILEVFSIGFAFVESQSALSRTGPHATARRELLVEWLETAGEDALETIHLVGDTSYDELFERSLGHHLDALRAQLGEGERRVPPQARR